MPASPDPVELWITAAAVLAGFGLAATMAWLERRPKVDLNPRMIPTTAVMLLGAGVGLIALVHLANLWGIHTGR